MSPLTCVHLSGHPGGVDLVVRHVHFTVQNGRVGFTCGCVPSTLQDPRFGNFANRCKNTC